MYMAPEMVDSHVYTEKVDVFSLAVMLFEALRGRLNVMRIAMGGDPEAVAEYARKVADGHREPLPSNWPPEVRSLIESAWEQVRTLMCCSACAAAGTCRFLTVRARRAVTSVIVLHAELSRTLVGGCAGSRCANQRERVSGAGEQHN